MAFTGYESEIFVILRLDVTEFQSSMEQINEALRITGNTIEQNLNTSLSDLYKSLGNIYTITNKYTSATGELLVVDEKFLAYTKKLEKAGYKHSDALKKQIRRLIELYPKIKDDKDQLKEFKKTWDGLDRAMKGNLKTFEGAASIFKELEEQTKETAEQTEKMADEVNNTNKFTDIFTEKT